MNCLANLNAKRISVGCAYVLHFLGEAAKILNRDIQHCTFKRIHLYNEWYNPVVARGL